MCANMEAVKSSDETDTTKTASTPTPSERISSSLTLNELDNLQYDTVVMGQLARQLEYYFSQANLEKDTYVETLRQLNDGYVPVSILTTFSKVQSFAPMETGDAVFKAATEFTDLLEVVPVDTKTGKRVHEEVPGTTILAVGPVSGKPLQQLSGPHPAVIPTSPRSDVQNTIIIREVDSRVSEADVRALFDDENCPPIQSLYLDFADCWFVTMDTESRDDMLYVMMRLRSQYLGDEPVKARLKSLVRTVDPSMPTVPVLPNVNSYSQLQSSSDAGNSNHKAGHTKKKQNKRRSKTNNNRGNNSSMQSQGKNGRGTATSNQRNQANEVKKDGENQRELDLSPESFPALSDQGKKVEVVVDDMDATDGKPASSDSSSTATTTSSSSSSVTKQTSQTKQPFGGYAAALLKSKPANAPSPSGPPKTESNANSAKTKNSGKKNEAVKNSGKKNEAVKDAETKKGGRQLKSQTEPGQGSAAEQATPMTVKPPTWGGGRSFADVLRKEEAAA